MIDLEQAKYLHHRVAHALEDAQHDRIGLAIVALADVINHLIVNCTRPPDPSFHADSLRREIPDGPVVYVSTPGYDNDFVRRQYQDHTDADGPITNELAPGDDNDAHPVIGKTEREILDAETRLRKILHEGGDNG
ncbi:MAG: hypothetical protein AB7U97_04680 [Pirellulales bacterium]